jgi:hypothetical protein
LSRVTRRKRADVVRECARRDCRRICSGAPRGARKAAGAFPRWSRFCVSGGGKETGLDKKTRFEYRKKVPLKMVSDDLGNATELEAGSWASVL